jgi:nucleotide-binding universal stress UspA family protein
VSEETDELTIRRILVALDASRQSLAALEAATDLGARMQAELIGLFVEDVNLLRLAELPFAQEVGSYSAGQRQLTPARIEEQLRAQAERARRSLQAHAERASVPWSFEVARGVVTTAVLTAASRVDLVILGRTGHAAASPLALGSTAQGVASAAGCHTLVISHARKLRLPVLLLFDDSPLARRSLAVACSLLQEQDRHLIIFALGSDPDSAARAKQRAAEWLVVRGLEARFQLLTRPSAADLVDRIEREGCGMLVLPTHSKHLDGTVIMDVLAAMDLPALLVR